MSSVNQPIPLRTPELSPVEPVRDRFARPLRDLRLSVLDRCNLRCDYCMPADSLPGQGVFLPRESLLTDEELLQLVRVFSRLGVHKVRLTGGEPLLRPRLHELVSGIAQISRITDLALTTNAILLPRQAKQLREAGLHRITISLDSLEESTYREMSGGRGSVAEVLKGIEAAESAGFESLKINTVVQRGVNDDGIEALLEYFRHRGHTVRLIEFMDVGNLNHWTRSRVVPSAQLLERIHARWPLRPVASQQRGETARRYAYEDGAGEVGFIASITQPFCGDCTRGRVTADGTFYSCLFASRGAALRPLLRQGASDEHVLEFLQQQWERRDDRYSELRESEASNSDHVEMFRMGG